VGGLECGGYRCGAVHTHRSNISSELDAVHEGSQTPSKRLCLAAATHHKHLRLIEEMNLQLSRYFRQLGRNPALPSPSQT
jgi:hypothetical protein